jgi:phosphoribosylanthranilate isomerase
MKLKICGLKDPENILQVLEHRPDYIGFIFYKGSPRYIGDLDPDFVQGLTTSKKVGVFVNETEENILKAVSLYGLNYVQLHGDESPALCANIAKSVTVIKAFQVDDSFSFTKLDEYENSCNAFLFDSKSKNYGGSGRSFDHKKLEEYQLDKPVFLSGGLDLNITEDIHYLASIHPLVMAIDVNSRFEISPGIKDSKKIKVLTESLRKYAVRG